MSHSNKVISIVALKIAEMRAARCSDEKVEELIVSNKNISTKYGFHSWLFPPKALIYFMYL